MESEGLEYRENENGDVVVAGRGTCADEEIVIPSEVSGKTVVGIDDGAFKNEEGVRSVTILEGIEYIGDEAFFGCADLEKIFLPSSLKEIGGWAFGKCNSRGRSSGLREVHVADLTAWCGVRISAVNASPFLGCAHLYVGDSLVTDLVIPDSVRCVSRRAFAGCGSIETLTVSDGTERIMEGAFSECVSLRFVMLGGGLKKIDEDAFRGSNNIKAVINLSELCVRAGSRDNGRVALMARVADRENFVPVRFTIDDDFEFIEVDGITSLVKYHGAGGVVNLPQDVYLGRYDVDKKAFLGCDTVTEVVIPPSVTRIGERAFAGCTALLAVRVGCDVREIGASAFDGCVRLYRVSLGRRLEKIGDGAFDGCVNLLEVENLSDLEFWEGDEGFGGVALHAENVYNAWLGESQITRREGFDFFGDISDVRLVGCPGYDATDLVLPNFEFPYTVSPYIYSGTLYAPYLTVPWCVLKIGDFAFYKCCDLRNLVIEEGVDEIGVSSFELCFALASVVLPKSVKRVGANAFADCECLCTVYYGGSKEDFEKMEVESGNEHLTTADIYYYSEEEPDECGVYWCFGEDGNPVIW